MADVLQASAPRGTNTKKRGPADTETPPGTETRKRLVPASARAGLEVVSGGAECGGGSSTIEALLASSSDDEELATLNTFAKHLGMHEHRTLWNYALDARPLTLTQVDDRYKCFRSKLIAVLLDEPIEDGVTHPGEHVIDEALRPDSAECQNWLSQILGEHYPTRPSLCASILRCIGRLDYDRVGGWGMRVADDALQHKDIEVREAAIRALEAWGGPAALGMLRRHEDAEGWLNEYVQQVIVDLSGTAS